MEKGQNYDLIKVSILAGRLSSIAKDLPKEKILSFQVRLFLHMIL